MLTAIKWSAAAAAATILLGFISMGALGGALYYAVAPLLSPFFGEMGDWSGDWVWPGAILAGSAWGLSFIPAGFVNLHLKRAGTSTFIRRVIYFLILWFGAALVWFLVLSTMRENEDLSAGGEPCLPANLAYMESNLRDVFGDEPHIIDDGRCLKSPFNTDLVGMAELDPNSAPDTQGFEPFEMPSEVPVSLSLSLYPEIFTDLAPSDIQIASSFHPNKHVGVHLLRLPDNRLFLLVNDL